MTIRSLSLFAAILFGGLAVWLGRVEDPDALLGPPAPRSGAPAPDLELLDLDGQPHTLADYRGRPVIINFWATWCPPCRAEMPDLQRVYDKYRDDGLVILAVNQGEAPADIAEFVAEYELTFPVLLDSRAVAGSAYEVEASPSTYFIDRQGRIRQVAIGGPMSRSYIKSQVLRLLG